MTSNLTDLLLGESGTGRCLVAPNGIVLRANDEWLRSTGFTAAEVLGKNFIDLFPGTREVALEMHARARAGNKVDIPRHARRVQGRDTWWEGSIAPVWMEGGTGLLVTMRAVAPSDGVDALSVNEDTLRGILNATRESIWLFSAEGVALAANGTALARWRKPPEEIIGKSITEYTPGPLGEARLAQIRAVAQSGKPLNFEDERDGLRFEHNLYPLPGEGGRVERVVVYSRDVTQRLEERRLAEVALRASEARYRKLFESIGEMLTVYSVERDESGQIIERRLLDANPAFLRAVRVASVDEIRGRTSSEIFGESWSRSHLQPIQEALATGQPRVQEVYRSEDGRHYITTVVPLDANTYLGTARDITERKRAEEAIREREEWLDVTLHSIGDGVISTDEVGHVTLINKVAQDLTGWKADEAIGQPLSQVFHIINEDTRQQVANPIDHVLREGIVVGLNEHTALISKDGTERPIADSGAPIRDLQGHIHGVVLVFRDKTQERRMEVERARLAAIVENTDDAILSKDLRGTILTWNAAAARLLGYGASEAVGQSVNIVIPPDRQGEEAAILSRIQAGERVARFETKRLTKAGRLLDVSVTVSPLLDHEGRIVGASKIMRDIADRKHAEEALRTSEEQARAQTAELLATLACVGDGVIVYDRDGRTLRSSPAADEMLGIPAAERTRPVQERVAAQYVISTEGGQRLGPEEMISYRAAVRGEVVKPVVNRVQSHGHEPRWLMISAMPLVVAGEHKGAVLSMTDVTERKRAEEALRASERRLGLAFDTAGAAAWEVDLVAGKHFWEDRFFPLLCVPAEQRQWAEQHWTEFVLPEDRDRSAAEFTASCAEDGPPYDSEFRARRMDGVVRWFRSRGVQIRDASGGRRMVGFVQDITDQKEAQEKLRDANEKLREADRRKDEFLGMLSHELRNPLAPIRNSTYILRRVEPGSEQARRAQAVIERQTEHLARLVDDLLDVTRIARGKIELRRSCIDLREVVLRAADDFRMMIDERGVAIRLDVPAAKMVVDADATRMTQVLGNLLHNAAKFTPRGGEVTLSLRDADGHAEMSVSDTGAGIDPVLLPNIFDAFVQGERTLARTEGGLGLGLALVKGLTELHGGTVRVESEGAGKGARFVVRIPLASATPAQERRLRVRQRVPNPRRVLVVDDNRDAAQSLAEVVEMLGHDAEVAFDGPSAVEKVSSNPPDIVLCDLGLPGMSGYDVAKAIRARGNGVRLFAVSGYAQPEDVRNGIEAGFDGHVAKPTSVADIEQLLR